MWQTTEATLLKGKRQDFRVGQPWVLLPHWLAVPVTGSVTLGQTFNLSELRHLVYKLTIMMHISYGYYEGSNEIIMGCALSYSRCPVNVRYHPATLSDEIMRTQWRIAIYLIGTYAEQASVVLTATSSLRELASPLTPCFPSKKLIPTIFLNVLLELFFKGLDCSGIRRSPFCHQPKSLSWTSDPFYPILWMCSWMFVHRHLSLSL